MLIVQCITSNKQLAFLPVYSYTYAQVISEMFTLIWMHVAAVIALLSLPLFPFWVPQVGFVLVCPLPASQAPYQRFQTAEHCTLQLSISHLPSTCTVFAPSVAEILLGSWVP